MSKTRRQFLKTAGVGLLASTVAPAAFAKKAERPNIIWLMAEDICPDLSCYGTKAVETPNLDKMATEGVRFTQAFCTAPVCSASRSAMMLGAHQNTFGAHQHRTDKKQMLPDGVKPITQWLEEAGYYTCLMVSKKTDCNFKTEKPLFMGKDWSERKQGQPFFSQITLANTHRSWGRDMVNPIDPKDVELPPYYPDTPLSRRDWADGLEEIQMMDRRVGEILKRLDDEGIADNTLVFFIGDNGRCHIRGKQFLYDGGLLTPLLIRWPEKVKPGQLNNDLVMTIDISATILSAAGVKKPSYVQGHNLFASDFPKRKYVFAARDKMDDTHDSIRAARSKDFKYILNQMPERAWCQYNRYKEAQYPMLALMNVMNMKGKLTPAQALFMAAKKPKEELFDLRKDPHEIHNVAGDPEYQVVLKEMRGEMAKWRKTINDKPVTEEFRKGGWPADYPTKTLEEWEAVLKTWEDKLLRGVATPKTAKQKKPTARK